MRLKDIKDRELRLLARLLRSKGAGLSRAFEHMENWEPSGHLRYKRQPRFYLRVGTFLGRPTKAIISSKGKFVLMRPADVSEISVPQLKLLDPINPDACLYAREPKWRPWGYSSPMKFSSFKRNFDLKGFQILYGMRILKPQNQGVITNDSRIT